MKTIVFRILEQRIGKGILSKKELVELAKVFEKVLDEIGITPEDFVTRPEMEKETLWQAFRFRLERERNDQKQKNS